MYGRKSDVEESTFGFSESFTKHYFGRKNWGRTAVWKYTKLKSPLGFVQSRVSEKVLLKMKFRNPLMRYWKNLWYQKLNSHKHHTHDTALTPSRENVSFRRS